MKASLQFSVDLCNVIPFSQSPSWKQVQRSDAFSDIDNGGGIIIYVREDIPTKILTKHNLPEDIEGIFLEINFRKSKWLLCGIYHPPSQNDQYFF